MVLDLAQGPSPNPKGPCAQMVMCVCIYIYICICIYMYMYICICIYSICMCVYVHTPNTYIYIYMCVCVCIYIYIYIYMYTPKCQSTYKGTTSRPKYTLYWYMDPSGKPIGGFRAKTSDDTNSIRLLGYVEPYNRSTVPCRCNTLQGFAAAVNLEA